MFKLVLEKAEEPEIKLLDHGKSKRVPEKHLFLLYWLCQSLWLCGSKQTVENSESDGNIRPPYLPPEKFSMEVKKQQLELDMEQQTSSKSGKEYIKAIYCHSAYLTYMQSTSCEILGWINHKQESRLPEEISTTSNMQMHCLVTSVISNSLWPHGPWPARLLCPWDSPGKNTGVGCHFLLHW